MFFLRFNFTVIKFVYIRKYLVLLLLKEGFVPIKM